MRVPISWLREFVDVTAAPEELGWTLSMRGFELGAIEQAAGEPVLDFEIMANRPDCLSVAGLAREAATAYDLPLRDQQVQQLSASAQDPSGFGVTLEAPDLCPRYSAAIADVKVGKSPDWLAARLQAAGIRPINNIVDVTNYVLLEIGQPMHAFDIARLAGNALRIRRAAKGERITTLDGVERALGPDMLVIADQQKPQAVAGVMGGGQSEVSERTTTVVLESACFEPKSVRITSRKLGLKTEASARFERGSDIDAPVKGLERACALIAQIGAGTCRPFVIDRYPSRAPERQLVLRRSRIERVLGATVPDADVRRILTSLGFRPVEQGDGWTVTVPTFRVDVVREVDLIEEIGRHHGYDRLPTTFPALEQAPPRPDPGIERDRLVRRLLLAAGCSEAISFSFVSMERAAPFVDAAEIVPISNPLTTQFAVLRPSLLPGLLAAVAHNRHRQQHDVRLFEIGAALTRRGQHPRVAVAWTGDAGHGHWTGGRRPVDFFDAKGLVEKIGEAFKVHVRFESDPLPSYLVRGRSAAVAVSGQVAGVVGLLTPAVAAGTDSGKDQDVYVVEIDLDIFSAAQSDSRLVFTPLARYPSIERDISIVVDNILPARAVRGTIRSAAPDTLVSIREFDRYQGKGVAEGRVSLSLRLTFRSPDRTLTDAEVDDAMSRILTTLKQAHNAVQR